MEKTKRVRIGEDRSLIIELDCGEFHFSDKDYLKSDRGKIMLKHGSVMQLADRANVVVDEPEMITSQGPMIYVFSRTASCGGKTFTAIGETNKLSLFDDIMKMNPATTADNRAYERAVLSVLGIYGDLYGASEINYKDRDGTLPSTVSKTAAKTKKDHTESLDESNAEKESAAVQADDTPKGVQKKPVWWDEIGFGEFKESELDPETFIVTMGPSADKNWTVKQLYDYDYKGCVYFAERSALDKAKDDLKKQAYACRRAIRKYGLK